MALLNSAITVQVTVNVPVEKAWQFWTLPEYITEWNNASDDWFTPSATNDLREGGTFLYRMEAKDGSVGFDFSGVYEKVRNEEELVYRIEDGRKVTVQFAAEGATTTVTEIFEPENTHPAELQQAGWQAILDNFKKYAEANG